MDIFYFYFYLKTFFVDPISLYYFVFCFASNFICHGIHISRHYVVGINFGTSCSLACNVNIQLIMGGSGKCKCISYIICFTGSSLRLYVEYLDGGWRSKLPYRGSTPHPSPPALSSWSRRTIFQSAS